MNRIIFSAVTFCLYYTLTCFSQGNPEIIWSVQAHPNLIYNVSVTSNGQMILTSSYHQVRTFSIYDGSLIDNFEFQEGNLISSSMTPLGDIFAVGYIVGTYPPFGESALYNLSTGSIIFSVPGCFTSFSPRGLKVAATGGGVYRNLNVHLIENGIQLFTVYNGGYPGDLQFSPNDSIIAVASSDNTTKLYDSEIGTLLQTFSGHTNDVNTITFSPDGLMLASGAGGWDTSGESTIKIWDVLTGELITTLVGHDYWVDDLAFSTDGVYLISSGRDGLYPSISPRIKIWRTSDWELEEYYDEGLANGVLAVTAVPGTNYFLYGNTFGELYLASLPDIVPVELASFSASISKNVVTLNWKTATELNNAGFEVLRCMQNEEWEKIGFVEGYGNSISPIEYSYTDEVIKYGSYSYRLKQIDFNGSFEYSEKVLIDNPAPIDFSLHQNYPNPFNPSTKIYFSIPQPSKVVIKVFDILGNEIVTLVNEEKSIGTYEITWYAEGLPSGVYFYRLQALPTSRQAGDFVETKKLILMK